MTDRVLITGGTGMIGSHLVDEIVNKRPNTLITVLDNLEVGKNTEIFNHKQVTFVKGSVLDEFLVNKLISENDITYHLATLKKGNEIDSSLPTLNTITKSAEICLEASKLHKKRIVIASTSDVYGYGTNFPFSEDDPISLGPFNTRRWSYAVAKLYTEQLAYEFFMQDVDVRVVRYFGGFSERSSFTWRGGHPPLFAYNAFNNINLTVHGDGSQTRCVAHGSDLAFGTRLLGESENCKGELVNIGSDEELSIKVCAEKTLEIFSESTSSIIYEDTKEIFGKYNEIKRRKPNLEKANKLLGYAPRLNFEDSMKIMKRYLQSL